MFDTNTEINSLEPAIDQLRFADKNIATQNFMAVANGCSQIEAVKSTLLKIDQGKYGKAVDHLEKALDMVIKRDLEGIHENIESAIQLINHNK